MPLIKISQHNCEALASGLMGIRVGHANHNCVLSIGSNDRDVYGGRIDHYMLWLGRLDCDMTAF